ncbi:MAG: FliI/YscN family ATPase [Chloroflexi bacterium]|nr:FliI/YscN family ATPase [Chloroflexota bacterium]
MLPAAEQEAPAPPNLERYARAIKALPGAQASGRVVEVVGLTIEAKGLVCEIGERVDITVRDNSTIPAEVVGFRAGHVLIMPLAEMTGIQPGSRVTATGAQLRAPVGRALLGRVLDGLGQPIDGLGPLATQRTVPVVSDPPHPLRRKPVSDPLVTGVRAIDGLITVGKGQRIGIFSGSGVGKSTLLGCIARSQNTDVTVIALIGERGREVREFVTNSLGPAGLARSVIVVSTSDQPALVRVRGAWLATAIADSFRNEGMDVTFLMDSVTRVAMAQREIGLAIGEPPASKGYTPSVFALLPKLMERTGNSEHGTTTGFYTVLVEGDDFNEPISDAARSILDGHIMLTRELAARNHFPAIDVLHSVSRVMPAVAAKAHLKDAGMLRQLLAAYEKARDLINIGAYVSGSDATIDAAIRLMPEALAFLQQDSEPTPFMESLRRMGELASQGAPAPA